ncbi:hypothetical protein HanPSC8_Chr01g0028551 [Helianthus annuus]|nr:hypothetical protein HanPSC8_Chr01g0028551 [Helianthus annuus]
MKYHKHDLKSRASQNICTKVQNQHPLKHTKHSNFTIELFPFLEWTSFVTTLGRFPPRSNRTPTPTTATLTFTFTTTMRMVHRVHSHSSNHRPAPEPPAMTSLSELLVLMF